MFGRSPSPSAPHPDEVTAIAPLAEWLKQQTWSDFAQSLADQFRRTGRLSPKQIDAAANMKAKCEARRARQADALADEPERRPTGPDPDVPAGRYAVEEPAGTLHFYKVDRPDDGRWAGYTFLSEQAGPNEYPVRDRARRAAILAAIAADPHAALIRYGRELGICGVCASPLTNEASRAAGIGPVCATRI